MSAVSFKIHYTNPQSNEEVRRLNVVAGDGALLDCLRVKLCEVFPELATISYSLYWHDNDNDKVVIKEEEELQIALAEMADKLPPYRLYVNIDKKREPSAGENKVTGQEERDWTNHLIAKINKVQKKCENIVGQDALTKASLCEMETAARQRAKEAYRQLASREAVHHHAEVVQEAVKRATEEAKKLAENPGEAVANAAEVVAAMMEPLVVFLRDVARESKRSASGNDAHAQSSESDWPESEEAFAGNQSAGASSSDQLTGAAGASSSDQLTGATGGSQRVGHGVEQTVDEEEWGLLDESASGQAGQSTASSSAQIQVYTFIVTLLFCRRKNLVLNYCHSGLTSTQNVHVVFFTK
jgi:hypothetical protein